MKPKRIFVIPDIHGRYDLLKIILTKLFDEERLDLNFRQDSLIFLGDMIDRGPDSKKVIETIRYLRSPNLTNVIVLGGNHEWLCINAYMRQRADDFELWNINGGDATIESYGGFVPEDDVKWMAGLPLFHTQEDFFFSHAPVPLEEHRRAVNKGQPYTMNELTWTYYPDREDLWARNFGKGIVGVCGHVHQLRKGIWEPRLYDHYIFADAGCGCALWAPLVAIEVKSRKVIYSHEAKPKEVTP